MWYRVLKNHPVWLHPNTQIQHLLRIQRSLFDYFARQSKPRKALHFFSIFQPTANNALHLKIPKTKLNFCTDCDF